MTTITVNVLGLKGVIRKLKKLEERIGTQIRASNKDVAGLYSGDNPGWSGASANEFNGLYWDSVSKITGVASKLEEIAEELEDELAAWQRLDSGLSR